MYLLNLICMTCFVWVCAGVAVSDAALKCRDAVPSMGWAYDRQETDESVIITVRDFKLKIRESENGALILVDGPVAWPAYGKPRLPVVVIVFEVPATENYAISWSETSNTELPVPTLASVPTPVVHSVSDGVHRTAMDSLRDGVVYGTGAYWPERIVRQEEARGAGRRFMRVEISPFQYQPLIGLVRLHQGLKVVLTKTVPTRHE